jgi:hypothetical protein
MDNTDNNNIYINNLFIEFRFNPLHYYIYCMGYIINLITYILLFSADLSTLDKEEENKDKVIRQILA